VGMKFFYAHVEPFLLSDTSFFMGRKVLSFFFFCGIFVFTDDLPCLRTFLFLIFPPNPPPLKRLREICFSVCLPFSSTKALFSSFHPDRAFIDPPFFIRKGKAISLLRCRSDRSLHNTKFFFSLFPTVVHLLYQKISVCSFVLPTRVLPFPRMSETIPFSISSPVSSGAPISSTFRKLKKNVFFSAGPGFPPACISFRFPPFP